MRGTTWTCRWATDWLTTLLTATKVPCAPSAEPIARATRWAEVRSGTIWSSPRSSRVSTCRTGQTSTWPLKTGWMSRNAITVVGAQDHRRLERPADDLADHVVVLVLAHTGTLPRAGPLAGSNRCSIPLVRAHLRRPARLARQRPSARRPGLGPDGGGLPLRLLPGRLPRLPVLRTTRWCWRSSPSSSWRASAVPCRRAWPPCGPSLRGEVRPDVVETAAEIWLEQGAALMRTRRAVGLIGQALRGRTFLARL